jgi:WD40 repeat protein
MRRGGVVVLLGLVLSLAVAVPASASAGWSPTGSLLNGRQLHAAALLDDGRVLVTGGEGYPGGVDTDLATAEIYSPAAGTWTATGSMHSGRESHTATPIQFNMCFFVCIPHREVLVAGGSSISSGGVLASAEVWDGWTGTWRVTASMSVPRVFHTATSVITPSGPRVLVAGGGSATAELYNPQTGTWSMTGSLHTSRSGHTATLLADGRVLVVGGDAAGTAELYNPTTGSWSLAPSLRTPRHGHTATLVNVTLCFGFVCFAEPRVLVAGGGSATAEVFDVLTSSWLATGSMHASRSKHTATALPSGLVLVAGGEGSTSTNVLASAELYDPQSGVWSVAPSMTEIRENHTATLLQTGRVLVSGGFGYSIGDASTELFSPA